MERVSCLFVVAKVLTSYLGHSQAEITFIHQPMNVSVYEGASARFNCSFTGSIEVPFWVINRSYYDWSGLPTGYSIDRSNYSLIIDSVTIFMNETSYSCIVEGVQSDTAFLYVLSNFTGVAMFSLTTVNVTSQGYYSYATGTSVNRYSKCLSSLSKSLAQTSSITRMRSEPLPLHQKNVIVITVATVIPAVTVLIIIVFSIGIFVGMKKILMKEPGTVTSPRLNIDTDHNAAYGIVQRKLGRFIMTENVLYEPTHRLRSPVHNNMF